LGIRLQLLQKSIKHLSLLVAFRQILFQIKPLLSAKTLVPIIRNMRNLILILFAVILTCNSCKKYEQDGERYFKTPCGRVAKKWQLYKIVDKNGRDYTDSVIYFTTSDNGWAFVPEQSYTYGGMIIEFERSKNKLCLETEIRGNATVFNKPFNKGYYEIRRKRTEFKFDIEPHTNSSARYFFGDYKIFKMTSDELIFGQDWNEMRAYFKVAN
jgi:hypothetical protein